MSLHILPVPGFHALLSVTQQAYEDIFDDALASQTPVIPSPTQPIVPVVTQHSPIHTCMTGTDLFGHQGDHKCSFVHGSSKKRFAKMQEARKGVHTSMLNFLWEQHIQAKIDASNGKPHNTSGIMIQIHSGFSRQCTVRNPFYKLRSLPTDLSKSKQLLTPYHHHLLFEDFLLLGPGTDIALLLCYDHPVLYDKTWQPLLKRALENNPIVTRTIVGKQFFVFKTIIHSNLPMIL